MSESLRHDAALACAYALLEMAAGLLMECERAAFHDEAYAIVLNALQTHNRRVRSLASKLEPSRN